MRAPPPLLFQPGDGALPPALTGRAAQQEVLSRCLASLVAGSAPPHNVVLLGPRGNGKTALLVWFKAACTERSVDVVALTPRLIPDQQALVDALVRKGALAKWLPRKIGVASLGSAEWQHDGAAGRDLVQALIARSRKRPLAVLLDEAHTLALDVGGTLLNASQQVRAEAPFLLALAGTPGLPDHLSAMDASFWPRLGRGLLRVGRLDAAAARQALVKPLAAHGVEVDCDALDAVVDHSQCYPYFIQLWGDALWEQHTATGTTPISAECVAAAKPGVVANIADYYHIRQRELRAEGLLDAAVAIAPLFRTDPDARLAERDLETALAAAGIHDAADRFAALADLNRLGYVWCPPGQLPPLVWSAGIPSLMTYILEHCAAGRVASGSFLK